MASGSLARRYARALEALAAEERCIERVERDLTLFEQVLAVGDGALRDALVNPGLTSVERRAVLDEALRRVELHPYVENFLRLLVDRARFGHLEEIHAEYIRLADEHFGRVRAAVTTAHEAGPALRAEVVRSLETATGKTVIVEFLVDPWLLGGLVARVGDVVYDASVRGRLNELRLSLARVSPMEMGLPEA